MTRNKRPAFRHDGQYVYTKAVLSQGKVREIGEPVDNSAFNVRSLRLLFENRKIDYASQDAATRPKPPIETVVGANRPSFPEPAPSPTPAVDVPDDWQSLHWKVRQKLAEEIAGVRPRNGAAANAIIEDYVA